MQTQPKNNQKFKMILAEQEQKGEKWEWQKKKKAWAYNWQKKIKKVK